MTARERLVDALVAADASRLEAEAIADLVREIAREELASQSALVLRRLRDLDPGVVDRTELAAIFGEALRDFGGTVSEPGPKAAA